MAMQFKKASKAQAKARIALIGPAGSGKTYSALAIASALGERIAVIDTEHGSASKYADRFAFDVLELDSFAPGTYVEAIEAAQAAGYDVLVIDSLSHAWMGKDGALEQVDKKAARSKSGNSFAAWRDVTPQHNRFVEAMVSSRLHLVVTMRSKTEWVVEDETNKDGKTVKVPRKIGLAPIQRDGLEFEFDVVGDIDLDHRYVISKTRCSTLDNAVIDKPGAKLGETVKAWLLDGVPAPERPAQVAPAAVPPAPTVPHFKLSGPWKHRPLTDAPLDVLQEYWQAIGGKLAKAQNGQRSAMQAHLNEIAAVIEAKEAQQRAEQTQATFGDDANEEWGMDDGPACNEPPATEAAT